MQVGAESFGLKCYCGHYIFSTFDSIQIGFMIVKIIAVMEIVLGIYKRYVGGVRI
jgi:hypothetical protein